MSRSVPYSSVRNLRMRGASRRRAAGIFGVTLSCRVEIAASRGPYPENEPQTHRHMTTIMVMPETLPLASVKARFSELVDRVQRQQDRVVVTRNGQPAAVLISTDDLESLEETLAVMSDRSLTQQIRASQQSVIDGEPGSDLEALRADLQRRRAKHR
jgi:antitoxin YefM